MSERSTGQRRDFLGVQTGHRVCRPAQRMDFFHVFSAVFKKVSLLSGPMSLAPFVLKLITASMETAGTMEMVWKVLRYGQESGSWVLHIYATKTWKNLLVSWFLE